LITISRCRARQLRAVFRPALLGITTKRPVLPLVFQADPAVGLRVRFHHAPLAVEQIVAGTFRPTETILVPLDVLAEVESRDDSPVVFESIAPDRTLVRWDDRGIPQHREHTVPEPASLPTFPDLPASFESVPASLLDALAEAGRVTSEDNTRYDLRNIQFHARTTELIATDGHQLLIQRTGRPTWDGDVLVRPSPLFASKALPRDRPIRIGKTDSHVVLQVGDVTIWLTIQTDARFPRIDGILPADSTRVTSLQFDTEDAAFLATALDRLPGANADGEPITIDLNGQIAIRAQGDDERPTEVVLNRSRFTGMPVRLSTNRRFLAHALDLGFGEIRIPGPEGPLVAQDGQRTFVWQPLNVESAIAPTDAAQRIESATTGNGSHAAIVCPEPRTTRTTMPERASHNGPATTSSTNGQGEGPSSSLAQLIRDAEALHTALAEAKAQTTRLIAGLRSQRKKSRLVHETLRSLRQLGLAEVAE
jgi:hypothetical protein